jgi:hypothetical protein
VTTLKDTPDLKRHNRFIFLVSRIHTGHKELSSASLDYRKAGLALIEQDISDTLCSLDQDLILWSIFDQIEAFFSLYISGEFEKEYAIHEIGRRHGSSDFTGVGSGF